MIFTIHTAQIKLARRLTMLSLALLLALSAAPLALAEEVNDPPRLQNAGSYSIEFLSPVLGGNHLAEEEVAFRFRVTDGQGQPAGGLNLLMTGIRDYSGQVKKEHNGPRTPNIGPLALLPVANGVPGEYQASMRFNLNGHWYVQVDGPSLNSQKVTFRTPIGVAENKGAGVNMDWFTWLGVLLVVITIVTIIGRRGEVFPTPHHELQPAVPAPDPALVNTPAAQEPLVTSGRANDPLNSPLKK